ncbi:MAG: hypothetical protein QM691_16735 [Opitutaceae bacterium]
MTDPNLLKQKLTAMEPRFQFSAEDTAWFQAQLEATCLRVLPKLIRKRIVSTLPKPSSQTKPGTGGRKRGGVSGSNIEGES